MKVVDLFAGCGGLSLGFARAGYEVVAAYDYWQAALDVYRRNLPDHPATQADLSDVETWAPAIAAHGADVIIGGPPCQDFSSAGKRNEELGRADLTVSFARIVAQAMPRYFVMENVARIVKSRRLQDALAILRPQYSLYPVTLDASLCGAPQSRKRFFLIGAHDGDVSGIGKIIAEAQAPEPMTVRRYFREQGQALDIDAYYRHPRSYQRRAVYGLDEPSPTIRGVNRPVPPDYQPHAGDHCPIGPRVRPLTREERAMIQTFPPDYVWTGVRSLDEQLIGNAVPVELARFVAQALRTFTQTQTPAAPTNNRVHARVPA